MNSMRRIQAFIPSLCHKKVSYANIIRERLPSRIAVSDVGERIIPEPKPTLTGVEEVKVDWKYVERLIPQATVPDPPAHAQYPTPSGWVPQKAKLFDLSYLVRRTRFHNFPIYLESLSGGGQKMTVIRRVDGNIWALEKDLRQFLETTLGKKMYTQVDEVCCKLRVRGAFVKEVNDFFIEKGL